MSSRSDAIGTLWRTARRLGRSRPGRKTPPLLFVTDPQRIPDPVTVAKRLPRGAGIVFRGFGRPDQLEAGRALRAVARSRRLVFLVGADPNLARALQADGVHLPERRLHLAPRIRRAQPRWILTGAAHSAVALTRAGRFGLDAALLSPVFDSRSPSAGRALGPLRFARLVCAAKLPVYGLGGVTAKTAPRLVQAGASGLAAVDGVDEVRGRA